MPATAFAIPRIEAKRHMEKHIMLLIVYKLLY